MQALREVVDSQDIAHIFSLPQAWKGKRLEVVIMPEPVPSTGRTKTAAAGKPERKVIKKKITLAELDAFAASDPVMKRLSGALEHGGDWSWLPPPLTKENLTMHDITGLRLKEKYPEYFEDGKQHKSSH
jgi:hypothetical protein